MRLRAFRAVAAVLLGLGAAAAEFSPLSIHPEGLGMPLAAMGARERGMGEAGMAAISSQGYFLPNASRAAFFDRTSFVATFESDLYLLRDETTSNRNLSATVPTIATTVKTQRFGALGLHFQQAFQRRFSLSSSEAGVDREYAFEGGLYLLGFSWAYSPIPLLAFGFSENFALGRDRIIETASFTSDTIPPESERLEGDTLEMRHRGSFPAFSLTVHTRLFDAAASYALGSDFSTRSERRITGMTANPVASASRSWPFTAAFGLAWRVSPRQTAALDFYTEGWEDSLLNRSYKACLGYEWRGSGNPYEDYYKRMSYRAGLGQEILYLREIPGFYGTFGVGLPLGPRGHTLDIGIKVGHRSYDGNSFFTEDYVKLSASVVGVGVWGQPIRKRR